MPPRTAFSTPLRGWRCPQCTRRAFSATTAATQQVAPESPRYIQVPESPQQTIPYRPHVKGILPVPRDVFTGNKGKNLASDRELAKSTPEPVNLETKLKAGGREEWKAKVSAQRRQNLREGLKALRARKTRTTKMLNERGAQRQAERERALHAPEREDERLTAPSHGLDLEQLYNGPLSDPGRQERLASKTALLAAQDAKKSAMRQTHLHDLYHHARTFIVTPAQLNQAVEEAFGTDDNPVHFGAGTEGGRGMSVWDTGAPPNVQQMLARAQGKKSGAAVIDSAGSGEVNLERIGRIGEVLGGAKMERRER